MGDYAKNLLISMAFLMPLAAFSAPDSMGQPSQFQPLPVPQCTDPGANASDAVVADAAECKFNWIVISSYNENHGDKPKTIKECAYITQKILGPEGPPYLNDVIVCTTIADNLKLQFIDNPASDDSIDDAQS